MNPLVLTAHALVVADFEASTDNIEVARVMYQDGYAAVALRFEDTSARRCRAITVLEETGAGWTGTGAGSCWRGSASDVWWHPTDNEALGAGDARLVGIWIDFPRAVTARIVEEEHPARTDTIEGGVSLLHFDSRPGPSATLELATADGGLLLRGPLWHPPMRSL
jgi:hypothetical protein